MEGKQKVALTFALYQNDALVRRETVTQDIVKVGKDAKSHLRVDDELASRMHAVIEVASPEDITLIDLGNEPGHDGERRARQQVQDQPRRSAPDRRDQDRARARRAGRGGGGRGARPRARPRRRRPRPASNPFAAARRRRPTRSVAAPAAANPFGAPAANPFGWRRIPSRSTTPSRRRPGPRRRGRRRRARGLLHVHAHQERARRPRRRGRGRARLDGRGDDPLGHHGAPRPAPHPAALVLRRRGAGEELHAATSSSPPRSSAPRARPSCSPIAAAR